MCYEAAHEPIGLLFSRIHVHEFGDFDQGQIRFTHPLSTHVPSISFYLSFSLFRVVSYRSDHGVAVRVARRHGGLEPRRLGGPRRRPRPLPGPCLQEKRRGGGTCPRKVGNPPENLTRVGAKGAWRSRDLFSFSYSMFTPVTSAVWEGGQAQFFSSGRPRTRDRGLCVWLSLDRPCLCFFHRFVCSSPRRRKGSSTREDGG